MTGQERQYCELEFTVYGATNLPKKDRFGACDAYVKVNLVTPDGGGGNGGVGRGWVREKNQTKITWRSLNPVWKQNFHWEVRVPMPHAHRFVSALRCGVLLRVLSPEQNGSNHDPPQPNDDRLWTLTMR